MSEIIEFGSGDNNNNQVAFGDERATQKISFQLAQDFYNEITGRSEQLKELSSENFILTLTNIEQLHFRITQSTEQYNVCSSSESYTIEYINNATERFSSFERFKLHAGARECAVGEIIVRYKILIILPKTQRPQEYTITIKMASKVAKIEEMRKEMKGMPFEIPLHQFEHANAAIFTIDYVDSTVAHAFMSVLKNWFSNIEKKPISKLTRLSRTYSPLIRKVFKYSFLSLCSYYVIHLSETFLSESQGNTKTLALFILISFLAAFLSLKVGMYFGRTIEKNLDEIYEPSYIKFSTADENFVKNSTDSISKSFRKAIFSGVYALLIGILASVIANNIN